MKKLRILIADDHPLVRRGARSVLHSQPGWKVVGEATNGREAVEKAVELKPQVAVIDISMPELDGLEVARKIRQQAPETKVLMLTMHESEHLIQRAMDAGAHGFILKSDLTKSLVTAIEDVCASQHFLAPNLSVLLKRRASRRGIGQYQQGDTPHVTPRETEIICHLAQGKTNREVAALLGITVRTVETHRAKLMLKLGFHSLADLIHYAIRNDIAALPDWQAASNDQA